MGLGVITHQFFSYLSLPFFTHRHGRPTPHNADNAKPNLGSRGDAGTALGFHLPTSPLSIWSQKHLWLKFSLSCLARFGRPGRYVRVRFSHNPSTLPPLTVSPRDSLSVYRRFPLICRYYLVHRVTNYAGHAGYGPAFIGVSNST